MFSGGRLPPGFGGFAGGGLPPGFGSNFADDDGAGECDFALYEVLGVEPDASADEIRKAYKKGSLNGEYRHPDRGGDPKKFQMLQAAHEVLSDADKRALFDHGGLAAVEGGGGAGAGGVDVGDLFSMLFGGGMPRGAGARSAPRKGENTVHPLRVTLEDCFKGKTIRIGINRTIVSENPRGELMDRAGRRFDRRLEREDLSVAIDRGTRDGQRIVFAGKGDVQPGLLPGDVVLAITVADHAVFSRKGADLIFAKSISLCEAITGVTFPVVTLDGRTITVKSRDGFVIKPDAVLEVPNEGMPVLGMPQIKGSLFIKVSIIGGRAHLCVDPARRLVYSGECCRITAPAPSTCSFYTPSPPSSRSFLCSFQTASFFRMACGV